jgi:acetyl-CoA C-acetyltransferase
MSAKLNEPVYLLGAGCTRFGNLLETPEIKDLSLQELAAKAVKEALKDAQTDPSEIDMFIVGNHMPQSLNMGSLYSQISKWIGTELKAGVQISAACSTTNVGATLAAAQIASGVCKKVLVVGLEATQNSVKGISPFEREPISTDNMWMWTDFGVNQAYSVPQGYDIFPSYNGFVDLGYCRKYGYTIDEFDRCMMELCRTRRLHGSLTPKAFLQETLEDEAKRLGFDNIEDFWKSKYNPFLAWPSRLRSVVTAADGASAMVLSNSEGAKEYPGTPVEILGWGISVGDKPWYKEDPTVWPADVTAFEKAYAMSGINIKDVGYLHTHDCSHISGICSAEVSGYLPVGEGLKLAAAGELRFDGSRPMSTHGGRHAFGHAWAASAGSDTYEAVNQIRGRAGAKQIKKEPEIAVVHTHGYAMISTVLVLKGGM